MSLVNLDRVIMTTFYLTTFFSAVTGAEPLGEGKGGGSVLLNYLMHTENSIQYTAYSGNS